MESSQILSKVSWIKHYQEENLHSSPAMDMEPIRIYGREGFSVSVPAPILMAFSSLAKRLFIPKTGGGGLDIFLPSVRGRTLILLQELLKLGTTNDILGPGESMKEVQELMQLLEIYGRIDVVSINKGNSINDKKHIQRAPLNRNTLNSKLDHRNDYGVRNKPDFSVSRDTDGDREFSNRSDIDYVLGKPTRCDKSWDKKFEDENGHFMLDKADFSKILMVSSDTDDDSKFSDVNNLQSEPMSPDNALVRKIRNWESLYHVLEKPDSSNVLVLPSNTNGGRVFGKVSYKKHLPSKSPSHKKATKDGGLKDRKGLCALDKPKIQNNVVSSNDRHKINTGDLSNHIDHKNRLKNISKFCHGANSESRTRKRFRPKTVLHSGSKKNLLKMSQIGIEEEKGDSKLSCNSNSKVAASEFTMKRSYCDVGFEAIEVSDDCDNDSTNEDMNNNGSDEVILENEKNGSEALVEGQERLDGLMLKESSVEESIPESQIEFLALFNLCTHAHAEQIRERMANKPATSRLKRSRAKKNK